MTNGRVLSEEEVQRRLSQANGAVHSSVLTEAWNTEVQNLITTIRAEQAENKRLREENSIMLSALEQIHRYGVEKPFDEHSEAIAFHHVQIISADTIAQVKSLTVSKQEESTVSEVACEQPTKDSVHVARQNNPTHPTQQTNRLAQEVESDLQWREGESP